MSEDREAFLSRWSRRKIEAREESAEPPAPVAEAQAREGEPPAALPPVETLTPESDFRPFMGTDVEPQTRRAALKKLFTDAHFNVPDPFEAYSEDYTKAETIPLEMLKTLNQARSFLFEESAPAAQPEAAQQNAVPASAAAAPTDGPPAAGSDHVPDRQDT